jgi:hypothetical protein
LLIQNPSFELISALSPILSTTFPQLRGAKLELSVASKGKDAKR